MGGLSAAKATLEPHGGEWLPRRGTGRGDQNASLDAIPEPLGDVFLNALFDQILSASEVLIKDIEGNSHKNHKIQ